MYAKKLKSSNFSNDDDKIRIKKVDDESITKKINFFKKEEHLMKNYAIEDAGGAQRTENSVFEKELLPLQPAPGSPASPSILNLPPGSGKWRR
jgi:hypothetical protein